MELDKIPLIKHTRDDSSGKTKMVTSVTDIQVKERRSVVEHKIPGMEGGIQGVFTLPLALPPIPE